jgi:hypothetical protein
MEGFPYSYRRTCASPDRWMRNAVLGRAAKAEVLGAARFVFETASAGPNQITVTLGSGWKHVDIDHRILTRIETARAIGIRAVAYHRLNSIDFLASEARAARRGRVSLGPICRPVAGV